MHLEVTERPNAANIYNTVHTKKKKILFLWKALLAHIPDEAGWGMWLDGCHPLPEVSDRQAQSSGQSVV